MQQKLNKSYRALPAEKRTDFIMQGNFSHFCAAAAQYPKFNVFPGETWSESKQLEFIIDQLIKSSDFYSLNNGTRFIEDISFLGFKALVFDRVSRHFDLLPMGKVDSASNTEKVNYLALLNRLEKLDDNTLYKIVETMDRKTYKKEKYFFTSLGYLQYILAAREVDAFLKQEMLELANGDLIADLLDKQKLFSIFFTCGTPIPYLSRWRIKGISVNG
jgi:hypothetical protein